MNRIGILPGSFDPPTLGHLAFIKRAQKVCDHLIIAISKNRHKSPLFSIEEREAMLKSLLPNIEIVSFKGLVADFAKKKKGAFLIRGVRTPIDFDFEMKMAEANRLLSGIETFFLPAEGKYSQISSSLVREIASLKGNLENFVPKKIELEIRKKF